MNNRERIVMRDVYEDLYDTINEELGLEIDEKGYMMIHMNDTYEYSLKTDIAEFIHNEMEDDYIDDQLLEEDDYKEMYKEIIRWITKERCKPFSWEDYREVAWWFKRELKEEDNESL